MNLKQTTEPSNTEIRNTIKKLKNNKVAGLNNINNELFKTGIAINT